MIISTLRFGELEIPDDKIIAMEKPVLGFEQLKKYCLVEREDCEPFLWFQSLEDPAIAFLVVNPVIFYPDYRIEVNPKEIEELLVNDVRTVETYVIVTVPQDPQRISINLQGPILINTDSRLAKQLVMVNSDYRVKHYILKSTDFIRSMGTVEEPEETLVGV
jgi:flagellar assembly factor FliW